MRANFFCLLYKDQHCLSFNTENTYYIDFYHVKLHAAWNETMQRSLRSLLSKLQANFQVYEDLRRTLYVLWQGLDLTKVLNFVE
jgi:hypothetical protein